MKVIRGGTGCHSELPDTVAEANGPEEIVEKFREVYKNLYNSAGTQEEMAMLHNRVAELIKMESIN